jgi:two-component system, chemotaxis family, sensor kinase CheA
MTDDDLLVEFLNETKENLASVDSGLLKLESSPDDAIILADVFRLVHTIKGTSGFLNLPRLGRIAHVAENVLGSIRDGKLVATSLTISAVLKSIDRIRLILRDLEQSGQEKPNDDLDVINVLERIFAEKLVPADIDARQMSRVVEPGAGSSAEADQLFQRLRGQTIRVSVDVLDSMMNLVSELVLTRNQLVQIVRATPGSSFDGPTQRLSACTTQLQETLMQTRMQPIGQAWSQLPRMVRDLAFDLGKKVNLELTGEQTGLDRQVLELIKDPLMHMVRNAVDHGIETVHDRLLAGKNETGRIRLHASQEGGFIHIRMSDDGRGIQSAKLAAKAVENGLISKADAERMTDGQVQRLVFRAGLSTAEATTTVSGRGVGMDVVKSNIERIGGAIDISSVAGTGTEFIIKIPLTLAIVSALIVGCGTERFALPQVVATELVHTGDDSGLVIETINNARVLRLRNELLPLIDLGEMLTGHSSRTPADASAFIVVTRVNGLTFGLIVDEVFDTEEIVVKPLAPVLRDIALYSGATILGDGRVILILDADSIARSVLHHHQEELDEVLPHDRHIGEDNAKEQMLLLKIGEIGQATVPLQLVKRIEEIGRDRFEYALRCPVVQFQGELIPIIAASADVSIGVLPSQPVLMFSQGTRTFGLAVTAILDVVDEVLDVQPSAIGDGTIGTCILNGKVTELLDIGHYFVKAFPKMQLQAEVLPQTRTAKSSKPRLLLIDQNPFFRTLLKPLLMTAGYEVESVATLEEAHRSLKSGNEFAVILADLDGVPMAGGETIDQLRHATATCEPRVIALAANEMGLDKFAHLSKDFDGWATKFDSQSLLETVNRHVHTYQRTG